MQAVNRVLGVLDDAQARAERFIVDRGKAVQVSDVEMVGSISLRGLVEVLQPPSGLPLKRPPLILSRRRL